MFDLFLSIFGPFMLFVSNVTVLIYQSVKGVTNKKWIQSK
jgi:hypothetical protein